LEFRGVLFRSSPATAGSMCAGCPTRWDLSPAFAAMVRQGTDAALAETFSSANLGRVRAFGTEFTQETVRTLSDETATVLVPRCRLLALRFGRCGRSRDRRCTHRQRRRKG